MGLSEISHFGTFQRVGGKAGGFINKKFFHPSTMRNQEKLWKAQTEEEREARKQAELQKRRDEERQVEELRKQMYLSGQGKSTDFLSSAAEASAASSHLGSSEKNELKQAIAEQKRRAKLKRTQAEKAEKGASDEEADEPPAKSGRTGAARTFAKSRYSEDVYESEHTSVWGSWYSRDEDKWGFGCCKLLVRNEQCPLFEATDEKPDKKEKEKRGLPRREKEQPKEELQSAQGEASAASKSEPEPTVIDPTTLLDTRMLEAAAKRQKIKSFKELKELAAKKEATNESQYLEQLLQDPSS